MKPRSIQSLRDFDAAPPPVEGGSFLSYPLPHVVPVGFKLAGHVYGAHPVNRSIVDCLSGRNASGLVAVEARKYHGKVEVEYRRLTRVNARKEASG